MPTQTTELIHRLDHLIDLLEGRFRPTNTETWLKYSKLKQLPEFRHRRSAGWVYKLAADYPDIMRKECLPHQERGATLWCVERIKKALEQSTKKQLKK